MRRTKEQAEQTRTAILAAAEQLFLEKGVAHSTLEQIAKAAGVTRDSLIAAKTDDEKSPSHRLEHLLHKPTAFIILPIFALANTGIVIGSGWQQELSDSNSLGIIAGLVLGKPLGIVLLSALAVVVGICRLPDDLRWHHILGAGMLGGIGFTMSIFIANLAFAGNAEAINASKIAILLASLCAGVLGFTWLRFFGPTRVAK